MDQPLAHRDRPETQPSLKHPREDDSSNDSQSRRVREYSGPPFRSWDRTNFRVRRIPEDFDPTRLSEVMRQIFELEEDCVIVNSLALDAYGNGKSLYKTATISFREVPKQFGVPPDRSGYWSFEIPAAASPANLSQAASLSFDKHFHGFTPLSPVENEENFSADCILIHGWGGHALGAWTSTSSRYSWPRDALPQRFPQLRVWTYGYDSKLNAHSIGDIQTYTSRFVALLRALRSQTKREAIGFPIIFMVHSLGGLIFKEAMCEMSRSTDKNDLGNLKSTYGAMFFGVPGQGMKVEALATMVGDLPARYTLNSLDEKLGFLSRNRKHAEFCKAFAFPDSRIVHFYEREETPAVIKKSDPERWVHEGTPSLLVDPNSATHGRPEDRGEEPVLLNGNHRTMVKFSENDFEELAIVFQVLEEFLKHAKVVIESRMLGDSDCSTPKAQSNPSLALDAEQKRKYMDSLKFEQLDARHATIRKAHAKTCAWFLDKSEYKNWMDVDQLQVHNGFLWIVGNPATGKSTLMKFLNAHAEKSYRNATVISFFFNARGTDLEKSVLGAYRSLLVQLLEKHPELQVVLERLPKSSPESHNWTPEEVQDLIHHAVGNLTHCTVMCFVDALDECDEDEVREMVAFFTLLGQYAASSRVRFLICFSSRHYPHITIPKSIRLVLERQEGHEQDIITYLRSELRADKSKLVESIKEEIIAKASGIFLWVVLVVKMLNKAFDRGRIHALRKCFEEIPNDLERLFTDILTRDSHNMRETILCLQWILNAKRPLTLEELHHAILAGTDLDAISVDSPEEATPEDMRRFVLDSSKGLAEVTKSKIPTVQFIHESLRDYLLKGDGLKKIQSRYEERFLEESHEVLKRCCMNYIRIATKTLPLHGKLPKSHWKKTAELRQETLQRFPFLMYATLNVLHHADIADGLGLQQNEFMANFPIEMWIKLNNLLERYHVRRYTRWASLLYILAELNLPHLIRCERKREPCLEIEGERYGWPLFAAIHHKNDAAIEAFLTPLTAAEALHNYPSNSIPNDVDTNWVDDRGNTALHIAASSGSETAARLLLARNDIELEAMNYSDETPLGIAAIRGKGKIFELLLAHGADPNGEASARQRPLADATINGRISILKRLLARKDVDINAEDRRGNTALHLAIEQGNIEIVELLLSHENIQINALNNEGRTPLWYAAFYGRIDIAMLLLARNDIDVKAPDSGGVTPLCAASQHGYTDMVKLLLAREDVDVNVVDVGGMTPLAHAHDGGHTEIVGLLTAHKDIIPLGIPLGRMAIRDGDTPMGE